MSEKRLDSLPNSSPDTIAELLNNPEVRAIVQGHNEGYVTSGLMSLYIDGIRAGHKSFDDEDEFFKKHLLRVGAEQEHTERHETAEISLQSTSPLLVTRGDKGTSTEYGLGKYNPADGTLLPESFYPILKIVGAAVERLGSLAHVTEVPISDAQLQALAETLERHFDEQAQVGLLINTPARPLGFID